MKPVFRLLAPLLLCAANASAEVRQSAADGFFVALSTPLAATPAKAWAGLLQMPHWWSGEHTFSGQATNLSLTAEAGGCFCERWKGGSVEHGRVTMALPERLLRLDAALGPLQEFALKGSLSFWIRPGDDGASRLEVEYRVNGAGASELDTFAPAVDAVLEEQVARLKRYIETGTPDAPVEPTQDGSAPAHAHAAARAAILEEWKKSAEASKTPAPAKRAPKQPATKPKGADGR